MTPIVDGLEEQYQGRVAFQRVAANHGDGPEIIRDYNILGHPTTLLLDGAGQEVNRLLGPQSRETLETLLEQLLASAIPGALLATPDLPPVPTLDASQVAQGEPLYNQHCAECHGLKGEGQPNWKVANEDGSYPSPPHDNSGHTWHHGDALLVDLIANGVEGFAQTRMPIFGDQLTGAEIRAILEYMKIWWGPEERAFQWQMTWQERQQ